MKLIHNLSITPFTRKHEERERESGMGRRGPAPGQGGRPARDPAIKRAWDRLLDRVIVPRVVSNLKAKGTWVYVREHIKGAGKKSRSEHTGGAYWGSNFDPRKRDCRQACSGGREKCARLVPRGAAGSDAPQVQLGGRQLHQSSQTCGRVILLIYASTSAELTQLFQ